MFRSENYFALNIFRAEPVLIEPVCYKWGPEMSEDLTTKPMLEAILEGQRHIVAQLVDLRKGYDSLTSKVDQIAAKQDELAAKQDELAAKQDELAARQERLELRMAELGREVRDGLYDTNRAIEV